MLLSSSESIKEKDKKRKSKARKTMFMPAIAQNDDLLRSPSSIH
jgi:hypothetical protein